MYESVLSGPSGVGVGVVAALQQAAALATVEAVAQVRKSAVGDPAVWLDAQLADFAQGGVVNPYAEFLLRAAGFVPVQR
ncbi:hypothetical protein [Dermatophilus congolensis]|uniref:hypothetical protein n=1 Tax=Dermatophilus congolensis TaxID=1863 RepID=UPI001AAFEC14|nr:hypothetical protein [Dermatophilus congolensis]MBO3142540.1 hypothetical protein [Dermatophilus congolensis]MBO3151530.1 hypothetical protein [Dermatophilus congolensis]MBO3161468.1 hypothetical protein [Dermatophilus congolensis]MBO3162815.1 hypothetical protein [Dermatophilus congolensis]MBO3176369.1 hypothetical protein [Dermatophilus congolensis]